MTKSSARPQWGVLVLFLCVGAPSIGNAQNTPPIVPRFIDAAPCGANGNSAIILQATDPDGDHITYAVNGTVDGTTRPLHGTLSSGTGATHVYTPNTHFVGDDFFQYKAFDGQGYSNIAQVHVGVYPVVSVNNISVTEGSAFFCLARNAAFRIRLNEAWSAHSGAFVTLHFQTRDDTAKNGFCGNDYYEFHGDVTFNPGESVKVINVGINQDFDHESNQRFFLDVTGLSGAFVVPSGLQTGACTIIDDDNGSLEGIPDQAIAHVRDRMTYGVKWTVPNPENWHSLQTMDIRLVDDADELLRVRWDEASNTFSEFNSRTGQFMHPSLPGSNRKFEGEGVTMFLENTEVIGSGPSGPSVLLNLSLKFKQQAAGHTYPVQVFATNDTGGEEDLKAGSITVSGD